MSNRVTCPHCNASYTLSRDYDGKAVRCTTCQQLFRVRFPTGSEQAPSDPWGSTQPAVDAPIIPELMEDAAPAKKDEEEEIIDIRQALAEDSPRPSSRRSRDRDDDDDRPADRRKRSQRDDDYERPSRPAVPIKQAGTQSKSLVRGILGGIAVIVIIALKVWVGLNRGQRDDPPDNPVAFNPQVNFPNNPNFPAFQNPNGMPFLKGDFPKGGFPNGNFPKAGPGIGGRPIEVAPVVALEIEPSAIKADREERELPGVIDDVCVGGGGRFLLCKLAQEKKIAIFDVVEAKVVRIVPTPSLNAKMAASMDKWVVLDPATKSIQRFSLKTFERETTGKVDLKTTPIALALGSSSNGPLLIAGNNAPAFPARNETALFDLNTLTDFGIPNLNAFANAGAGTRVVASADGTTFVNYSNPVQVIVLKNRQVEMYANGFDPGTVFDDKQQALARNLSTPAKPVWYVSAIEGKYYLSISTKTNQLKQKTFQVGLHLDDAESALATRTDITGLDWLLNGASQSQPIDKHIFFIPDAKLLAVIPGTKDRVILHKWDVDPLLSKAKSDYLFVTSRLTQPAVKGQRFTYQLKVAAKENDVEFDSVTGPPGAMVSATGLISWNVPEGYALKEATFSVEIYAGNEKLTHEFRVPVYAKNDPVLQPAKVEPQP